MHLLAAVYLAEQRSSDTLICPVFMCRIDDLKPLITFQSINNPSLPYCSLSHNNRHFAWMNRLIRMLQKFWQKTVFTQELWPRPLNNDLHDSNKKVFCIIFFIIAAHLMFFLLMVVVCCVSVSPGDASVMWHVHTVPPTQEALFMQFRDKKPFSAISQACLCRSYLI